mgnify:CR=1 FL=1
MLVGTRSIDKSEHLSRLLRDAGVEHQVLNANEVAKEADITLVDAAQLVRLLHAVGGPPKA